MRGDVAARITEEKGGLVELSADGRMKTEVSTDCSSSCWNRYFCPWRAV